MNSETSACMFRTTVHVTATRHWFPEMEINWGKKTDYSLKAIDFVKIKTRIWIMAGLK